MQEETFVAQLLHFDPVQVVLIIAAAVTIWTKLRSSVRWHSEWIKKHNDECNGHKKQLSDVLTGLRENDAKLTVLVDSHCDRIDRLETWRDKQ